MAKVYAWPPVVAYGPEWSEEAPIDTSRSFLTGRRYASASRPPRRVASLSVSARGCGGHGAGYMEVLKRLLEGGEHFVRLRSRRINFRSPLEDRQRQSAPVEWRSNDNDLLWETNSNALRWFTGAPLDAVRSTDDGFPTLQVTGLPPSAVVAWPGEFVTVFRESDDAESTAMVLKRSRSNEQGEARIYLMQEAAWSGRVNIGTSESAVFEALSIPRAVRPLSGDWTYDWSFREVFENEVGGFQEVNPWR